MVREIQPINHKPVNYLFFPTHKEQLAQLKASVNLEFGPQEAGQVNAIIDHITHLLDTAPTNPYAWDTDMVFYMGNAAMALGEAIQKLLGEQPGIIQSEMSISNDLVSKVSNSYSTYWLGVLDHDETVIAGDSGASSQKLAQDQGQLNIDNTKASASSAGFNGVTSAVTQGVSAKTSTYQNLVQQSNQVVTGLLSFISQIWVL
jgi:hypothetical protein